MYLVAMLSFSIMICPRETRNQHANEGGGGQDIQVGLNFLSRREQAKDRGHDRIGHGYECARKVHCPLKTARR